MKLDGRLWITREGKNLVGRGRIELLIHIADTGSISQAAKLMGMSYKSAWDSVDAMNNTAGSPLVQRSAGGKGGGGTRLTEAGARLVKAFQRYAMLHRRFLEELSQDNGIEPYLQVLERLRLHSSARNQLLAQVRKVHRKGLSDSIELELAGGQCLHAVITHASTERLSIVSGSEVFALIKAPWVELASPPISEGNLLSGEVVGLELGAVATEVVLQLAGGARLASVVGNTAAELADLRLGKLCTVHIDPVQIVLCTSA